jgi:uncharacterized OsmC-like protein
MPFKFSKALTSDVINGLREKFRDTDPGNFVKINVTVDFLGEHLLAARVVDQFTIVADEPTGYGGFSASPAPLHYFVTGFALSESSQYIWHIADMGLTVTEISLEVDTENVWTVVLPEDTPYTSTLAKVDVTVHIESPEPQDRIKELCERVGRHGPAHNSLANPVEINSTLVVNGTAIQ